MSQSELSKLTPNFDIPILEYLEIVMALAFSLNMELVLLSAESILTYFKNSFFIFSKEVLTFQASCFIQV